MMNAKEARRIAEESDTAFKTILDKVNEKVEIAAKAGEYTLNLSQAFSSWDKFQLKRDQYGNAVALLSDFQKRLQAELHARGYGFSLKPYTYKEGGGLGGLDMYDNPPEEKVGYHIVITW